MRVAFYAPLKAPDHPVPSGDRRMARLLMAALAAGGHEVTLACRLRSWDDAARPGRMEHLEAIGRRCADRLIRRLAPSPPDLWFTYHLYHKAPDWLGPAVSGALGIPYVVAEASFAAKRAGGPWAAGHAAAGAAIRRAAAVITLTGKDAPGVEPLLDDPRRLVRLPPFVDRHPYLDASRERERHRAGLAARYGLPRDEPWLLAVGMMRAGDKARSYAVLADALGRLTHRGWTLVVAGDGPTRAAIETGFAAIAGRTRFVGTLDGHTLAALYAAADLMVWPAINEAYGMALLEAQAAGLAVVAGRTGGVPDVVRHGEGGLLVPVGDAAAFADSVDGLLTDGDARRAMGHRAQAAVARDHDFQAAVDRLRTLTGAIRAGRFP